MSYLKPIKNKQKYIKYRLLGRRQTRLELNQVQHIKFDVASDIMYIMYYIIFFVKLYLL